MWGLGGRYYWGRKERGKVEGIVVVFSSWVSISSCQQRHLTNYINLYSSLGWNSLVCHSHFLNLFFPSKAASFALEIVDELLQELKFRPCPVVFASLSGGSKTCMYKVLQIIEGKCEKQVSLRDYRLIRDCTSGYIPDHFHEYKAAVAELLGKAAAIYSGRLKQFEEASHYPFHNLRKAVAKLNQSFQNINLDLNDHFFVPGSVECLEERDVGSMQDGRRVQYVPFSSPPEMSPHGVLGQFLFDVCVPRNVDSSWDFASPASSRRVNSTSGRRDSPFNPMKCMRRSRL